MARKKIACAVCGVRKEPGSSSLPEGKYRCRSCKAAMRGCSSHYRVGCRCDSCRRWNRDRMREYAKRRKAAGNPLPSGDRWISEKDRQSIYARDKGVCQLCLEPVDFEAHYMAPSAPTLDHILPRSHGGADEAENLRLACRGCNCARSDRLDWEASNVSG